MGLAGSECWRIVLATMNSVFRKWGEPRLEMRRDLESNVPDWKGGTMPQYIPGTACWQPMVPKPPVHRRSSDRCLSRRWCLLACPYWAGKDCSAGRPPENARVPQAVPPPACRWQVSAFFERAGKENGAPKSSPDAPSSVPFCWSIIALPTCAILPQMNHRWMSSPHRTAILQNFELLIGEQYSLNLPKSRLHRNLRAVQTMLGCSIQDKQKS